MIHTLDGVPLTHSMVPIQTRGAQGEHALHVVTAGPADGAPVLLLHGFPDAWIGWSKQIAVLAHAGYRVIVPDQRGYGASAKPKGRGAYRMAYLVADIVALQDALCGGAPTHVVGHDWGGAVAWGLASTHPERVRTLTVLNCPRPETMKRYTLTHPRQLARSWYMLFFQLPWLPERVLLGGGYDREIPKWHHRAPISQEELAEYNAIWRAPGATTGMLNWYRAAFHGSENHTRVRAPTLMVWGRKDPALSEEMAALSLETCDDAQLAYADDAGHFVQRSRADVVNPAILHHLAAHGGPDPLVYKIVSRAVWEQAPDPWPGSPDDLRDGFVHLSAHAQVAGTLAKHFAGQPDLLVLAVDPARLPTLKWEKSRDGKRFPHLYGGLPKSAVVASRASDA